MYSDVVQVATRLDRACRRQLIDGDRSRKVFGPNQRHEVLDSVSQCSVQNLGQAVQYHKTAHVTAKIWTFLVACASASLISPSGTCSGAVTG